MVGSALTRFLQKNNFNNLLLRTHSELNLLNQHDVLEFFKQEAPEYVFLAAARVGGIIANNTYRADFIYENIAIQSNILQAAFQYKVRKLLFLGSSCIYPKNCPQPMKEDYLLSSELEYTNEPYAVAKICGLKMCEAFNLQYKTNFISVMPTNLYGPNDNYNLERSHVLPAMIRKFFLAGLLQNNRLDLAAHNLSCPSDQVEKTLAAAGVFRDRVILWGTGTPRREFLHADDLASACLFIMLNVNWDTLSAGKQEIRNTHINIGSGVDFSINEIARMTAAAAEYNGKIEYDTLKPDGTMRKLLDVQKINAMGWKSTIPLKQGIKEVYREYTERYLTVKKSQ